MVSAPSVASHLLASGAPAVAKYDKLALAKPTLGVTHPMQVSAAFPKVAHPTAQAFPAPQPPSSIEDLNTVKATAVHATPLDKDAGQLTFTISTRDGHVSEALRRFASAHGWKLSWEIDRDFDVQYDATFSGSFLQIVEQLAQALQNANTPIRVKAYHGNRVLRVLYATY